MQAKVRVTKEGVLVPKGLFQELLSAYAKLERIMATLEELADEEALKVIRKSRRQIAQGE